MALALATALLLTAAPTATPGETAWRACIDRTTTNFAWGQCGSAYVETADKALNAEWRRLMAATRGRTKTDLIAEERAWLAYRKLACKFQANGDAGREGQVLHYPACIAGVVERRAADLKAYRDFQNPQ